jgi:hypothetical protein
MVFYSTPPGTCRDWHTALRRQYVITLSRAADIGLRDGTTHRTGSGDVKMAEDLTGHGHTICVVDQVGPAGAFKQKPTVSPCKKTVRWSMNLILIS